MTRALYHFCGWSYQQDATGVAMANVCPRCGMGVLQFVQGEFEEVLDFFMRHPEIDPPAFLLEDLE